MPLTSACSQAAVWGTSLIGVDSRITAWILLVPRGLKVRGVFCGVRLVKMRGLRGRRFCHADGGQLVTLEYQIGANWPRFQYYSTYNPGETLGTASSTPWIHHLNFRRPEI